MLKHLYKRLVDTREPVDRLVENKFIPREDLNERIRRGELVEIKDIDDLDTKVHDELLEQRLKIAKERGDKNVYPY